MKPVGSHNYFVYIITNKYKTVLYTGVTNDLKRRLFEHESDVNTVKKHFTGKYNVCFLIYYERFQYIEHAIEREKQIKGWLRSRKEQLISEFNPEWRFLNEEI
jgi:putative endonuclease